MTVKFNAPSNTQVKEVLRRIPTIQLRRAFFEGLKNPYWVAPLAKEGAFSSPPEPESLSDGSIRDVYWPEIDYLIRVATDVPEAVVDVLLKLRTSSNAWVRRGVFAIGATIPAEQGARLQPLIKFWQSSGFGWRTDPRNLVAFVVNLLEGEQYEVGQWLADLIFKPFVTRGRGVNGLVLEDYAYEEGLPRVALALGANGLPVVLSWLVAYERSVGNLGKKSDISYNARDAVRSRGDSIESKEQVLIDAVRDLAISAMLIDASNANETLEASNMLLARKIAMFAAAEAIRHANDDVKLQELLKVATELLFDERSSDDAYRIDYAELARAVALKSLGLLERLTPFLEVGPRVDDVRLREWLRRDEEDDEVVDERVREYNEHWKHRWLSAIGIEALPARLQTELAELDRKYEVIDSPLEPANRLSSWTGPNSPISQDEMATMSPAELVAHLEDWHDTGPGWGPDPSHEGQAHVLAALVTSNPNAVSRVDGLVDRLRPTYLRAILQGWESALKADLDLEWAQVAALITEVLTHDYESYFAAEGRWMDDDENFRWAKQAAISLLEELAQKRISQHVPDENMAQFAELLINVPPDDTGWSEYISYDQDTTSDPLTISLNWQWPIRLRGLIYLMSHGRETAWYDTARLALENELSRADTRGASRAVLGEGFGRLLSVDPEWLREKFPEFFGSGNELSFGQQIALTTAMATHYYHSTLFEMFTPAMIAAIKSKQPIVSGWHIDSDPLQRIGEWAINAIIQGHRSIDDSVVSEFFSTVPARIRGAAIGRIAWQFMHAEAVDDVIRDRFADLWDSRMAHVHANPDDSEELNGFFWFVRSNKFPVEWWLPRLNEAVELDPRLVKERYMVGKELALSADVDPHAAFDVLKLLLDGRTGDGYGSFDLTRNAVPMVLARAISSGDEVLKSDAEAYMNKLGELGDLSLEVKVKEILEGRVTQNDVGD
jgi:hypothetical protein